MAKLLQRSLERSKYAGRLKLHDKSVDAVFTSMVAGQNQKGPGATYAMVAVKDGKVVGFMAGSLNRVYGVGDKLVATDNYLINSGTNISDTLKLIDGYIQWAKSNPKVIEIGLSWTDATPGADAVASIYKRKGFYKVGEQYEVRLDVQPEEEAA